MGIPESFKVGWYPPKKLGRVTLSEEEINDKITEALYNGTTSLLYMRTGIKTEEKMAMGEKEIANMATIDREW